MSVPQRDPEALDAVIFPGGALSRRARVERGAPPPETPGDREPAWDDHPQTKELHGEMMELFPVGALARAIGVTSKAVYKWERQRRFPPARFRTPAPVKSNIPGKSVAGQRMY